MRSKQWAEFAVVGTNISLYVGVRKRKLELCVLGLTDQELLDLAMVVQLGIDAHNKSLSHWNSKISNGLEDALTDVSSEIINTLSKNVPD